MRIHSGRIGLALVTAFVLVCSNSAEAASVDLREGVLPGCEPSRAVQPTVWFQGFLADAATGEAVDAAYNVAAEIYDAAEGGASVWGPETHPAVPVTDGWFSIELGSIESPLPSFDAPPYYLELTVNGETLVPRQKLASVPSALRASSVDDGDTDWTISGGDVYRPSGNVGIGTGAPQKRLHLYDAVSGDLAYPIKLENFGPGAGTATGVLFKVDSGTEDRGKGAIVYEQTNTWNRGDFHILQNSSTGTGLASLGHAVVTVKNNGHVGIGTTTPGSKLEVNGPARITTFWWPSSGRGLELAYNDDQNKGYVFAYDRDAQTYGDLTLGFGNVGIGTNYPTEMLEVDGVVYSTSGGFKFPDDTVQTTAGELSLPYSGSASGSDAAFSATNTDLGHGVHGSAYGYLKAGVYGESTRSSNECYGVYGKAIATNGRGVYGEATNTESNACGVYGKSAAIGGSGVRGEATGTGGTAYGVYGTSVDGEGVAGVFEGNQAHGALGTQIAGVLGVDGTDGISVAGYFMGDVFIDDVIRLNPRSEFPSSPQDGHVCVVGSSGFRHIYCYLNGGWRQLD